MNRRNALIRLGGLAAVLGGGWWLREHVIWPAPQLGFAAGGATPWLPYARDRAEVPTVRVRVGGREVIALIDSGAQYSVIHSGLYRQIAADLPDRTLIEIPLVAYGVGGGSQMGRGATLSVDLPGLAVGGLRAAILDLGPLAAEGGLRTPLILGRDVLSRLILALDPDRRYARLIAPEAFIAPPDLHAVEVRKGGGALITPVTVEGAAVDALVDTGASSLLALDRSTASAAGLLDGRETRDQTSLVLGGAARAQVIQARTVTFADQLYRAVEVGVYAQPPLPNFPGGLIGMAAFKGRRLAMDLGQGALMVARTPDVRLGGP